MHKPSRRAVYGVMGLAGFGVTYDCGLFGTRDGFDHSAVISIAASTGTVTAGVVYVSHGVTGEGIPVPLPVPAKATQV